MPKGEVWVILNRPPGPESDFVEVEDVDGQGEGDHAWNEWGANWALGPFARASVLGEIKELKDAAQPIIEAMLPSHEGKPDDDEVAICVTVGELRRLKNARDKK